MAQSADRKQALVDAQNALNKAQLEYTTAFFNWMDSVDPSTPVIENCKRGPTIEKVDEIDSRHIQVLFDAEDVKVAAFMVQDPKGAYINDIAKMEMTTNRPIIELNTDLYPGRFSVTMEAVSCVGSSVLYFTVVSPPPDGGDDCVETGEIMSVTFTE